MIHCTLCGSGSVSQIFSKKGFHFHQCNDCHHVFVFPLPTSDETVLHYAESYDDRYLATVRLWFEALASKRMTVLSSLYPSGFRGRLLDAGSGYGFFLAKARDAGWEVTGIEASPIPLTFARKQFNLIVIRGDIQVAFQELPRESYDVVTFWHVLEHVNSPAARLTEAIALIRPGGHLIVNSPNFDSTVCRLLGKRWSWVYAPGHVQYFSLVSLARWLETRGLSIVKRETWSETPNLYFEVEESLVLAMCDLLQKIPRFPLTRLRRRLLSFVYSVFNQQVVQKKLKTAYDYTPFLDRWLVKHDRGHELIVIARKSKPASFTNRTREQEP
ncbi:MAG TPA: class I SAM-dependent methyltransferase [Acidobacteriota bacterium]|jgi:2-polyprenyl-3-methyl-5-hydroxy-6-metoxy-1,4-benzoquinol methylase